MLKVSAVKIKGNNNNNNNNPTTLSHATPRQRGVRIKVKTPSDITTTRRYHTQPQDRGGRIKAKTPGRRNTNNNIKTDLEYRPDGELLETSRVGRRSLPSERAHRTQVLEHVIPKGQVLPFSLKREAACRRRGTRRTTKTSTENIEDGNKTALKYATICRARVIRVHTVCCTLIMLARKVKLQKTVMTLEVRGGTPPK